MWQFDLLDVIVGKLISYLTLTKHMIFVFSELRKYCLVLSMSCISLVVDINIDGHRIFLIIPITLNGHENPIMIQLITAIRRRLGILSSTRYGQNFVMERLLITRFYCWEYLILLVMARISLWKDSL